MGQGATFKKFDLHLHAPGVGQCFTMPAGENVTTPEAKAAFARRYVKQAHEVAGLDAIAITNHNDTSWVDPLREAAQDPYGENFVVFPGLEIGASGGLGAIHILAIFPEDTKVDILERFLDDDLDLKERFTAEGHCIPTPRSFTDVVQAIQRRNGIAIAAHVFSSEDSLLDSKSNKGLKRKREFCLPELLGVQIHKGTIEELSEWQRLVVTNQHQEADFRREHPIACLNASDARRLEDIGSWFTYVKCERPDFLALKRALLDSQARLRLRDAPPPEPVRYLSALRLLRQDGFNTTGFLREIDLEFNLRLNCLIGARGTGKSAVVELLRYLWEIEALRPKEQQGFADVFLPETGRAELEVVKDHVRYRLVRQGRRPTLVERYEPDGGWVATDLRPADLFQPQLYGQKEILYTSEHVSSQLELLDRFVGEGLVQLKRERDMLLIELRRNREAIIAEHERVKQTEDRLKSKARIEEQLRQYHQLGIQELAGTKRLYDRETQLWDEALMQLLQSSKAVEDARRRVTPTEVSLSDTELQTLPNAARLRWLRERMQRMTQDLGTVWQTTEEKLAQARADIELEQRAWAQARDVFEAQYRQALSEVPDLSPDGVLRLERERADLERAEREVEKFKRELQRLFEERREHLRELLKNIRLQHELRQEKAADITQRLQRIRVSVEPGRDEDWLRELWERYLRGSRLRASDYDSLIQISSPHLLPLLALLESAEEEPFIDESLYKEWLPQPEATLFLPDAATQLAQYSRLEADKVGRLQERLGFEARLELDEMQPPDRVKIEMDIALPTGNGEQAIWRALGRRLGEGVSVGQGCTAILSILLLESAEPLIIDQPEDDLDNRFVYQEIVETLRTERGKRQMLFATHNPNIPVAGDAELIVALDVIQDARDLHARVLASGFVDAPDVCEQVKSILEGGAVAFELRRMKYGF